MGRRRQAVKVKSSGPGFGARLGNAARTLQRPVLVWVLPTVALVSICVLGLHWARYRVAASPKYRIVAPRLSWPEPPAWWEKKYEDEICAKIAAVADGVSMFDESVLAKVAEACRQCAWVEKVVAVEKRFPNQIVPHIVPRKPVAAVAYRVGPDHVFYLIDRNGVRLPKLTDRWPPTGLKRPYYVFGVREPPPREPGMRWTERSVTGAIRIVRTLRSSDVVNQSLELIAVDVTNYRGRINRTQSEFLVHAEGGCVIEWGRSPGTDQPGELPAEEKVHKLERYLQENNPTTNRRLDLRFAGRVVVSRRTAAHGDSG